MGRGRAPVRLDLQTRDAFDAAIFYEEVFNWARPPGGCTVAYAQDHITSRHRDAPSPPCTAETTKPARTHEFGPGGMSTSE
ncbi:hypothetical protein ABZ622_39500 [Streptomyces sp. NPDC007164]|uniref:hypothetical protein n=1 Tax=Streptomyces sp. NPDC007164 TaxID=3156918 RepID=UPI0033ED42E7